MVDQLVVLSSLLLYFLAAMTTAVSQIWWTSQQSLLVLSGRCYYCSVSADGPPSDSLHASLLYFLVAVTTAVSQPMDHQVILFMHLFSYFLTAMTNVVSPV